MAEGVKVGNAYSYTPSLAVEIFYQSFLHVYAHTI